MFDGNVEVDHEALRSMAASLKSGAQDLGEAAEGTPDTPKVSSSAERVGYTLSEVAKGTAGLIAAIEDTASKIDASDASYGQVDNESGTQLRRSYGAQ